MDNKNKGNSLAKDIAIAMTVWGPLLFIIIGYFAWDSGKFDGTIMERLFPALSFGFIAAFAVYIILSNLFRYSEVIWWAGSAVTFAVTVAAYMLDLKNALSAGAVAVSVAICLLVLVRWIAGLLR